MKKPLLLALTVGFILFVFFGQQAGWFKSGNSESFPKFPETPSYNVTNNFDGEWLVDELTRPTTTCVNGQQSQVVSRMVKQHCASPITARHSKAGLPKTLTYSLCMPTIGSGTIAFQEQFRLIR